MNGDLCLQPEFRVPNSAALTSSSTFDKSLDLIAKALGHQESIQSNILFNYYPNID